MEELNRYMIIIIGNSKGIEKDLNEIADRDHGIDFVDSSKVIFLGTFFSPFSTLEIQEKLIHRPAFLLFDISNSENYGINLPAKYYTGLFPEVKEMMDDLPEVNEENQISRGNGMSKAKSKVGTKSKKVEEYTKLDDILDKLSRNNYNRECLTEGELEVLDSQK